MDYLPFLMLPVAFVLMFLGVQVAFSMMITAVLFGLAIFGDRVIFQFIEKIEDISSNFVFAAVPLFVFMGAMLEKSGIADKLFEAIHIWTRRLPGGLALATVLMCIFFAASSGVIGATESVVGLLTIPIMLRYGYDKPLISGTICAGGSLGTIIPPSVVAVVMGPLANHVGGRPPLRHGVPGPDHGRAVPRLHLHPVRDPPAGRAAHPARARRAELRREAVDHHAQPGAAGVHDLRGARLDPARLGLADGGRGDRRVRARCCSPCSTATSSWSGLYEALLKTLKITAMIMTVLLAGTLFTGVFIGGGGINTASLLIAKMALSPWMLLALMMLIIFIAGFFLDWISIVLIFVPMFTPLVIQAGFDPVWFCVLFLIMIQTSYLTPPMAPAIFYLRAVAPPEITIRAHVPRRRAVHRAAVLHARDRADLPDPRDLAADA